MRTESARTAGTLRGERVAGNTADRRQFQQTGRCRVPGGVRAEGGAIPAKKGRSDGGGAGDEWKVGGGREHEEADCSVADAWSCGLGGRLCVLV